MRKGLYHYYRKHKRRIKMIAVTNITYLSVMSVTALVLILMKLQTPDINDRTTQRQFSTFQKVCYVVFGLLPSIPMHIYLVLNIYNIDFRGYVQTMHFGLRKEHLFEGSSYFIKKVSICKTLFYN